MKSVDLWQNADGTWTARIYSTTFTGTYAGCVDWLRGNNEELPTSEWDGGDPEAEALRAYERLCDRQQR